MTIRDIIQGAGVIAAVTAAAFSYQASQTANELKQESNNLTQVANTINEQSNEILERTNELRLQTHDLDKALEILWAISQEAYNINDPSKTEAACAFITFVAANEHRIRDEPHLAKEFFDHLQTAGKLSDNCKVLFEASESVEVAATESTAVNGGAAEEVAVDGDGSEQQIGEWHALIATYNLSDRGCEFASRDVSAFARALSHEDYYQPEFENLVVRTAETTISGMRVVTVDAGEDRSTAAALRDAIRKAASDRGVPNAPVERLWSGEDAVVAGNRSWRLDEACHNSVMITAP